MLTERFDLEKELNKIISENSKDRNVKAAVIEEFTSRNILAGDATDIFTLRLPLSVVSQVVLYVFTKALYQATKSDNINPAKYFTELEIKEGNEYILDVKDNTKYPLIFKNVRRLNDDMWITSMTAQDIVELYGKRVIIYNPETQRELKRKEYHDKIVEQIDINKSSVQEIKKDILKNKFISNFITFNVLQNGSENFEYNDKNEEFIIHSGEVNILDGWHRSLGIVYAVQENNKVDFRIGIILTNFEVEKAQRYIVQEDKKNKMKKTTIKQKDVDNFSNLIVRKINENSNSYLASKIVSDNLIIKKGDGLVISNVLRDAIELTFNPKNTQDFIKYSKIIIDGLNHIIECKPELLENYVINQHVWVLYVCLIEKFYQRPDWKKQISDNIERFDVEQVPTKIVNKTFIKNLNLYISEIIGNI
jgi:hypothetical protein